ncbi:helix-turn-helix domain-containing protein [Oceanicaulis sp. UBA2681]|uniref:helix-turn-helix domain-containing protein n=1 Tax=Oceanicaulis sp. UBA2681 TaxID=1947007 RepID=UPI000EC6AD05|nr:hypothetical protein [Oceanicaulis sp.]
MAFKTQTPTHNPSDPDGAAIRGSDWLTTNQLARLLQISPSTLEKARSTGRGLFARLAYRKLGRSVRYSRDEVLEFLNSTRVEGNRGRLS